MLTLIGLYQYLTEALDKLEETKKALAQSNNELNQARKQAASFKAYIDELQKVTQLLESVKDCGVCDVS
jgi:DNA repair exonuclease SbcCD ATPase subunit